MLPSSVELLGQQVDLKPLQPVLAPLEGPLRGALAQLGELLSRQSDLEFPIRSPRASTWLLNTYLDEVGGLGRGGVRGAGIAAGEAKKTNGRGGGDRRAGGQAGGGVQRRRQVRAGAALGADASTPARLGSGAAVACFNAPTAGPSDHARRPRCGVCAGQGYAGAEPGLLGRAARVGGGCRPATAAAARGGAVGCH